MNNIGKFFDRFRNLALIEMRKREVVAGAIKKYIGVEVDIKDILIKGRIVEIKENSLIKSEIFLKKSKILAYIIKEIPDINISDIK